MLTKLLSGLPPVFKALLPVIMGAMPQAGLAQVDVMLDDIARDLANKRDIQACGKLRAFLAGAGVDLNEYVTSDSDE